MTDRAARFLQFSARLTGESPFVLRGTGMLDEYLAALDLRLPAGLLDELLARDDEDATMDDPKLGPVARNIIIMWYTGSWTQLPDTWTAVYGTKDHGLAGVISPTAYQAGLMWRVAGAHPAGAQQQGFGAWSLQPEGLSS